MVSSHRGGRAKKIIAGALLFAAVGAGAAGVVYWYGTQKEPSEYFELGMSLREAGDFQGAARAFRKAGRGRPPHPRAWLELGRLYFLGTDAVKLEEAVDAFSKEIEATGDPYAYHLRGILYGQKLGRLEDAEADFRKETELWQSWGAPLNLAWVLSEQGKLQEAEEAMRMVEQRRPGTVFVDNGLGVIYLRQGRLREAKARLEAAYEKAKNLDIVDYREAYPGNPVEYAGEGILSIRAGIAFNLGVVNEKMGDKQAAINWYRAALEILPDLIHIGIAPGVDEKALSSRIKMLE